jgi:hypothetical protein
MIKDFNYYQSIYSDFIYNKKPIFNIEDINNLKTLFNNSKDEFEASSVINLMSKLVAYSKLLNIEYFDYLESIIKNKPKPQFGSWLAKEICTLMFGTLRYPKIDPFQVYSNLVDELMNLADWDTTFECLQTFVFGLALSEEIPEIVKSNIDKCLEKVKLKLKREINIEAKFNLELIQPI